MLPITPVMLQPCAKVKWRNQKTFELFRLHFFFEKFSFVSLFIVHSLEHVWKRNSCRHDRKSLKSKLSSRFCGLLKIRLRLQRFGRFERLRTFWRFGTFWNDLKRLERFERFGGSFFDFVNLLLHVGVLALCSLWNLHWYHSVPASRWPGRTFRWSNQ